MLTETPPWYGDFVQLLREKLERKEKEFQKHGINMRPAFILTIKDTMRILEKNGWTNGFKSRQQLGAYARLLHERLYAYPPRGMDVERWSSVGIKKLIIMKRLEDDV